MTSRSYFPHPCGRSGEVDPAHPGEVQRLHQLLTEGLATQGAADIRLDYRQVSSVVWIEGTHQGGQGGWLQEFEQALRAWNETFNPGTGELVC